MFHETERWKELKKARIRLLRELILGGATHSMLKHMTVPVLMSH